MTKFKQLKQEVIEYFKQFHDGDPTKGKGIFKSDWYSFCSAHQRHNPACYVCGMGQWHNRYTQLISVIVSIHFPNLWNWLNKKGIIK